MKMKMKNKLLDTIDRQIDLGLDNDTNTVNIESVSV